MPGFHAIRGVIIEQRGGIAGGANYRGRNLLQLMTGLDSINAVQPRFVRLKKEKHFNDRILTALRQAFYADKAASANKSPRRHKRYILRPTVPR